MKFLKKYYKLIGTLITVVAFVFVIKKIVTMDVDWSMFASGKPLGIIAGCVLVQTAIIFFMSTPWDETSLPQTYTSATWTLPVPPFWKFCVRWWLRWCGSCCSWEKTWWD